MKKGYLIPILAVIFICSVFVVASLMNNSNQGNNVGDSITYGSDVCISTTGDFEGRESPLGKMELVQCDNNVLFDTGKDLIKDVIGDTNTADACDWIELCNSSIAENCGTPQADSSEDYTAYGSLCGMDKIAGTYGTLTGNGNWSISNTFTSTCDDVETNVTHLLNANADEFAGNEFTLVTLQTDDQLLINWTVWVT